jgi:hypothetical protein
MHKKRTPFIVTLLLLTLTATLACQTVNNLIDDYSEEYYQDVNDEYSEEPTQAATAQMDTSSCPVVLSDIINAAQTPVEYSDDQDELPYGEDGQVIIVYQISGDEIINPQTEAVNSELQQYQDDTAAHQEIWKFYAAMIPADQRTVMTSFIIMTDGKDNGLAAVAQDPSDAYSWTLEVDIIDSVDLYNLIYTLVHEYGHLLTLNDDQVSPDLAIFENPEDDDAYYSAEDACPNYFQGEGCAEADSYLNTFFNQFWEDIYNEWFDINLEEDDDIYYQQLDDFYNKYKDQFVTDYAATNPEEDIAESWAFFILQPKPDGDTIAEQKILFFYNYPELVSLREHIRTQICDKLAQP